jgi:hypothetical protein
LCLVRAGTRLILKCTPQHSLEPPDCQHIPLLHPAILEVQQTPPKQNLLGDLSCSLVAILPVLFAVSCRGEASRRRRIRCFPFCGQCSLSWQ